MHINEELCEKTGGRDDIFLNEGGCVMNVWFASTTLDGGHNLLPLGITWNIWG